MEFIKNSKKLLIGIIIVLVIIIIILLIANIVKDNGKKEQTYMKELASKWYEDVYYKNLGNDDMSAKDKIANASWKDLGVTIDLDNLERNLRSSNIDTKKIDYLKNEAKCNIKNTKAIVKPIEPYEKNNYKISLILDCNKIKLNESSSK